MSVTAKMIKYDDVKPSNEFFLDNSTVDQILNLYLPEHRYVTDAVLKDNTLTCLLKPTLYPYTSVQLFKYITAPSATFFVCQIAYVLVGSLVLSNHQVARSSNLTWDKFIRLRDQTLLKFANFQVRFRSEVKNKWPIQASINIKTVHKFSKHVHCKMHFSLGTGIYGNVHTVIVGDNIQ